MRELERHVLVLQVACLTEDRSPDEQRAMLALALEIDQRRGAFVSGNRDLAPPMMVWHTETTYDPSTGRHVTLTAAQRAVHGRVVARWEACAECGWPMGIHHGNDHVSNCPTEHDYYVRQWIEPLSAWRAHSVQRAQLALVPGEGT